MENEITLPQAALRVGRTWHATLKLAMRGEFGAVRQVAGRYLVSEPGVTAYLARRQASDATPHTARLAS